MKTIRLITPYEKERDALILSLANSGSGVGVAQVPDVVTGVEFDVFFEIDDEFVLEKR